MTNKKPKLGIGLGDILGKDPLDNILNNRAKAAGPSKKANVNKVIDIKTSKLRRGKYQPRGKIDHDSIADLASSIKQQGVIQPIVVRPLADNTYEILAGERRWSAAKYIGMDRVPVLVKDIEDKDALAISLIENLQREDLNALEEAIAIDRLVQEFSLTHQQAADALGKSRATISNILRLLTLATEVQQLLRDGKLEMGHARALLSLDHPEQISVAVSIIQQKLTVRATEKLVKGILTGDSKQVVAKTIFEADLQARFNALLGVKAKVTGSSKSDRVTVSFSCSNREELVNMLNKLAANSGQ